jgi:hypothetical protein
VAALVAGDQVLMDYGDTYWDVPFDAETEKFMVQPVINGVNHFGPEEVLPEDSEEEEVRCACLSHSCLSPCLPTGA